MRTYIFKDYLTMKHGKFIPMQTIVSEEFGRHFFIDIGFNFISAPSFSKEHTDMMRDEKNAYDESQLNYIVDWDEWEGVTMSKLLEIYRQLTWNQWQEDKDKAHADMCEYMEAVETGEIQFLQCHTHY